MVRLIFYIVLIVLLTRALMRLWGGFMEGLSGQPRARVPQRGVQMVRDPVCGTFVVPDRTLMISTGREHVYFCSRTCRDKYRAA